MTDTDAELVHYSDPAGNRITLQAYQGLLYPRLSGNVRDTLSSLKNWETRSDDVLICGYPKSGTNWVWEIVSILISGKPENIPKNKLTMMMEFRNLKDLEELPSPRILNTHVRLPLMPADIHQKKCRIIYLLRNPKDISVSHFHHTVGLNGVYEYDGDWGNYLHLWLEGKVDYSSWFDYVAHWEEQLNKNPHLNVHIIHYENLKLDFIGESKKLADFLGLKPTEDFFSHLAEICHINHMRKVKGNSFSEEQNSVWRTKKAGFFRKDDYRKTEPVLSKRNDQRIIGDWKQHFTVKQNEQFDAMLRDRLTGSKLNFKYECK